MEESGARAKMFSVGAEAVDRAFEFRVEVPPLYVCPICFEGFTEEALKTKELIQEHVPPAAVGGRRLVLTCRRCNNEAGHTIDAAVADRRHTEKFARALAGEGSFEGRAVMRLKDSELNVDLRVNEEDGRVELLGRGNAPWDIEALRESLDEMVEEGEWEGTDINVQLRRGYSRRFALVGDLKTAFLFAFAEFGYRFAGDRRLTSVREQISKPDEKILDRWNVPLCDEHPGDALVLLRSPFPALLVSAAGRAVLLPFPGGAEDPYSLLEEEIFQGSPIRFEGSPRPLPVRMNLRLDFMESGNG